jgi:hypothetical protein
LKHNLAVGERPVTKPEQKVNVEPKNEAIQYKSDKNNQEKDADIEHDKEKKKDVKAKKLANQAPKKEKKVKRSAIEKKEEHAEKIEKVVEQQINQVEEIVEINNSINDTTENEKSVPTTSTDFEKNEAQENEDKPRAGKAFELLFIFHIKRLFI